MCGGIGEPEEHPAIHWERIAGFQVDNKLWAKGSVRVILEPAGLESAPDGESRPPTPDSERRWTEEWLRRVIREEIQEAFAQRVRERNAAWNRTREGGD